MDQLFHSDKGAFFIGCNHPPGEERGLVSIFCGRFPNSPICFPQMGDDYGEDDDAVSSFLYFFILCLRREGLLSERLILKTRICNTWFLGSEVYSS